MREAARTLESDLRATSPVDTGDLRDATTVRPRGLVTDVRVAVEYATFVSEGTQPHTIVARNRRVLKFAWPAGPASLKSKDGFFYFPKVNHPGTTANDWYDTAVNTWPTLIEANL